MGVRFYYRVVPFLFFVIQIFHFEMKVCYAKNNFIFPCVYRNYLLSLSYNKQTINQ